MTTDTPVGESVQAAEKTEAVPAGLLVAAYQAGNDVMIERVSQQTGPDKWAVRYMGDVLNLSGEWEFEPSPSNRDEAFKTRCRFATPTEAFECLQRSRANG